MRISSFTIIKGSLIGETYTAFRHWDLEADKAANLAALRAQDPIGAGSASWLDDVLKALSSRFDPSGRDRALVELAQRGLPLPQWKPLLLWHMTRAEFLVRDFLIHWLYEQYTEGAYQLRAGDAVPYVRGVVQQGTRVQKPWSERTIERVARGLMRMAVDFELLQGTQARVFTSYHLPDETLLYLLHAMQETEPSADRLIGSPDWRMYLMDRDDVEREVMRLHQYRKLNYQVAGSLAQLELPCESAAAYAHESLP